jgi:hypothetical protein
MHYSLLWLTRVYSQFAYQACFIPFLLEGSGQRLFGTVEL